MWRAEERQGRCARRPTMSRDPRAHCAVSPFFLFPRVSLSTLLQTVREEILERSWRDSVSREYRCREDSLYPRILLCAASLASPAFLSFHRFLVLLPLLLSFNLRLDCRLHIVLFSLLSCPILNFSSVLRVPLCFPLLFFSFTPYSPSASSVRLASSSSTFLNLALYTYPEERKHEVK